MYFCGCLKLKTTKQAVSNLKLHKSSYPVIYNIEHAYDLESYSYTTIDIIIDIFMARDLQSFVSYSIDHCYDIIRYSQIKAIRPYGIAYSHVEASISRFRCVKCNHVLSGIILKEMK